MARLRLALGVLGLAGAVSAQAVFYNYVDWTSAIVGNAGSASGTLGGISVSYSGDVAPPTQTAGGTNYWIPSAPYLSAQVSNAPGTTDIITLDSISTGNTITFSQAVVNPIMHLVSVGRTTLPVSYTFNAAFTILSQGTGFWGGGATSFTQSGLTLTGSEGHGTIQFSGTFTSISFDVTPSENWHGFTIGIQSVPEPFTMSLGGLAVLAAARKIRRRKRTLA